MGYTFGGGTPQDAKRLLVSEINRWKSVIEAANLPAERIDQTDRTADIVSLEAERAPGLTGLATAVGESYHKVLGYKDEYEVARLFHGRRPRDQG